MDNIFNKNPLFDKNFLNDLFNFQHKEVYARITLLTAKENPLEQIEGKIIDGTVNIDGTSAVRRTCSLNMTAENININEFYWGLKNKFKLEVGLKNNINSNYPDIIWFKQGIFVITQFNTNYTINKWDIKIQGKDKMCLLNGEVGGALESSVDFGQIEEEDIFGVWTKKNIQIKDIIRNAVHVYGREPYTVNAEIAQYRPTELSLKRQRNNTRGRQQQCHIRQRFGAGITDDLCFTQHIADKDEYKQDQHLLPYC